MIRMMDKITEPSPRNDDKQPDPWDEFAGIFKDDPTFDEFVEAMATHRRELDAKDEIQIIYERKATRQERLEYES